MDIKVYPGKLKGTVQVPPSKSVAHRAMICASLSEGISVIRGISDSKDMEATIGCMTALGAEITRIGDGRTVTIRGIGRKNAGSGADIAAENGAGRGAENSGDSGIDRGAEKGTDDAAAVLDCIESGSTLRFILPVAGALGRNAVFEGRGKLPQRPMTPLAKEMKKNGIEFLPDGKDQLPFEIKGKLRPGVYEIPGNVSSQYFSGLLFALPLLDGDSEIRVGGKLESVGYIALTLKMLEDFGIRIEETLQGFRVPGNQHYRAAEIEVEGDYSQAAFWLAAAACGSELTVTGLREDSAQGDREAVAITKDFGAVIRRNGQEIEAGPSQERMKALEVDGGDIPDVIPVLSVVSACAEGTTRFRNVSRLRIKECDRLSAMADCLSRLGVHTEERQEELIVTGGELQGGCEVSGYNDHRIVMSMAVAALACREPVIIRGAEAVSKSYPDFFDELRRLGGRADVISDR